MDLKIIDVAELFNVSEATVRRWLKDEKIPAYQLNHQYRFNRSEVEDWMMKCKLNLAKDGFSPFEEKQIYPIVDEKAASTAGGSQQFSLYRAMHRGGVMKGVVSNTKEQLIKTVTQRVAPRLDFDPELMSELLLDREELMSTALNSGIAVPHARDIVFKIPGSDAIVTVFPNTPIDYGALDGQPVTVLFFLFSSSDKTHLRLLSKLAHLGNQPDALQLLASQPNLDALLTYVKKWEANI